MAQKDRLFALIQSLTREEKAHFTKFAQLSTKKKEPDYLRLFKAISKQKDYEEEKFCQQYEGENFVKSIHAKKSHLANKILESLQILYANRSVESEIQQALHSFHFLYERKLFKTLVQKLKAAKAKAITHEYYDSLIQLIDWEKKLLLLDVNKKTESQYLQLINEQQKYQRLAQQIRRYQDLAEQLKFIWREDIRLTKPVHQKAVVELMKDHLKAPDNLSESNTLYRLYYKLKVRYYRAIGEHEKACQNAQKVVDLFEGNALLKKDRLAYKKALCSFLSTCNRAKKYDHFEITLDKVRALSQKSGQLGEEEMELYNTTCRLGLSFYLNNNRFQEGIQLAKEIERKWESFATYLNKGRQLLYCYNIMILYWVVSDLREAEHWLYRILNFGPTTKRQDLIHASRLFQLVIYYDLEEVDFKKRIQNAQRTLKSNGQLSDFAQLVLTHFKNLERAIGKKDQTTAFQNFKMALQEFKTQNGNSIPLGWHELSHWLERKINRG